MKNNNLLTVEEHPFDKEAVKYVVEYNLRKKYSHILIMKYNVLRGKKRSFTTPLFVLRIAASVVFVLCSIWFFSNVLTPSTEQFALQLARETSILGNQDVMRKDHTMSNKNRLEANTAFIYKKYDEAIFHFEKLKSLNYAKDVDQFYLAVAYLKADKANPQKAKLILDQLNPTGAFGYEIIWFKSIAYIACGKEEEAKKILLELISINKYKVDEARLLLEKLNKKN